MATIAKQITTNQLTSHFSELDTKSVGKTNQGNIYVELNGEYYLVYHQGSKIPASAKPSKDLSQFKEVLIKRAINDEDVFDKLAALVSEDD